VPINRFADYFATEMQKQLATSADGTISEAEMEKYRIADLVFAFNNGVMLRLLKKRASLLNNAKFEKARAVELEMTKIKNEKYAQLVQPIYFYCTFMRSVGA